MFGITVAQVGSAVRSGLIFAGGYFVAKGYVTEGDLVSIATAVAGGVSFIYGLWIKRQSVAA